MLLFFVCGWIMFLMMVSGFGGSLFVLFELGVGGNGV